MNYTLQPNDKLQIKSEIFTIEKVINRGSSFITYIANSNTGKPYIIKEYFPVIETEAKRVKKDGIYTEITGFNYSQKRKFVEDKKKVYEEIQKYKTKDGKYDLINYIAFDLDVLSSEINNDYSVVVYSNGETVDEYFVNPMHSFTDSLELLKLTANICKEFYNSGFICLDLKPDNLYYDGENNKTLKFIDFDSFVKKGENTQIFTSAGYAPEEYYSEPFIADEKSIVYTLGVFLFQIFFGDDFNKYLKRMKEVSPNGYIQMPLYYVSDDPYICLGSVPEIFASSLATLKKNLGKKNEFGEPELEQLDETTKLWFFDILRKTVNNRDERYETIDSFLADLDVLVDIIEGNGCHPAVILKNILNVRKQEKEDGIFNPDNIEESLLTDIKPIE